MKIVTDTYDGRSKGFAFVEMATDEEAALAAQNLNGTELEGRSIRVDLARPKESRPRDNRGPSPPAAVTVEVALVQVPVSAAELEETAEEVAGKLI